jgi:branched-chain amino acid transport system substrate-binding protein
VDSQIVNLKNSGANVFFNITTPKFAVQAIKKANDIGWKPVHFLNQVSNSVGVVLKPVGMEASKDLISTQYLKDPTDPEWVNDPAMKKWRDFMKKYYPEGNTSDTFNVYGVLVAQTLEQVLRQSGKDLSRQNIMKQAASLKNMDLPLLLPGVLINTSATDFAPIEQEQLIKFDGAKWVRFGELLGGKPQH